MKESGIAVSEAPSVEVPDQTKKGPTGDEEEDRHHRHQFRRAVAEKLSRGGKLPEGTRVISGGSKKPEKPKIRPSNNPYQFDQEIFRRAHHPKELDIPDGYKPYTGLA